MTTFIQAVSEGGGAATVSPLHIWGSLSQAAQAQVSSLVNPSWITTLGTSSTAAPLTYDAIGLAQTLSPTISASGLNAAQQQELATASGLNANATSTSVFNAINALLMPADTSQVLVDVLVGDANAAAAETSPTVPFLFNDQGVIEGVPLDSVTQARDTALATLLEVTAGTVGGTTENQFVAGTGAASNNVPAANPNLATAEQIATAGNAVVTANPAIATAAAAVAAAVGTEAALVVNTETVAAAVAGEAAVTTAATTTAPTVNTETVIAAVAGEAAVTTSAAIIATAATPATAATNAVTTAAVTTTAPAVNTETVVATVVEETVVTTAATITATAATSATAATNAATAAAIAATPAVEAAPVAAATVLTTAAAAEVAAATQALQELPAANEVQSTGNLLAAQANVPTVQTATVVVAAPAVTELAAVEEVATPSVIAPAVASAAPAATAATANTIPVIRFDNARDVLQSLLAEAAAHAMIRSNPASATYSVGGALFQMGTGADHAQQATTKGNLPDIRDMTGPVSPVARIRGSRERQTGGGRS